MKQKPKQPNADKNIRPPSQLELQKVVCTSDKIRNLDSLGWF